MTRRRWRTHTAIAILLLVALVAVACGPSGGDTPVAQATPEPAATQGRCGDGVCDEVEGRDPSLCPKDCPATGAPFEPPTATPEPTPERCGDGMCDEVEQKDPGLCPQDCATPTAEPAVTVEVTPAELAPTPTEPPMDVIEVRKSVTSPSGELAFVGDPTTISQGGEGTGEAPQANVALILDASGSMTADLPGTGKTKLAVAKEVMAELIPQIPGEMNGTLWIYAHRYPAEPKAESCKDIEQVFSLAPVDATAYVATIQGIKAIGWTPISDSIVAAAEGLPPGDFNSVILVSDGEETCGGNPCAVAEALKASDTELTIHVVGYAVDPETQEQLQCVAAVSGGSYHDATDAEGLLQALEEALAASVVETVLRVEIVGPDGAEIGEDVFLYEAGTDDLVSAYRAWVDNVVAPGRFDLLVRTLPNIFYADLELPEGSTTIVRIIQSAISVVTPGGENVAADFFEAATDSRLGYWGHEGPVALVPGSYYIQVTGSTSAPISLEPGELEEVVLGTITLVAPDGEAVPGDFFEDATDNRLGYWGHEGPVALLPGSYSVVVNGSTSDSITLQAGQTAEVQLGAVHVNGSFTIWDADGKRLGYWGDTLLLVPGTYALELDDGSTVDGVVVKAGEVTEVK